MSKHDNYLGTVIQLLHQDIWNEPSAKLWRPEGHDYGNDFLKYEPSLAYPQSNYGCFHSVYFIKALYGIGPI